MNKKNYKYLTGRNNAAIFRVWERQSVSVHTDNMAYYNAWKNGLISLIVDEDDVKRESWFKAYMRCET